MPFLEGFQGVLGRPFRRIQYRYRGTEFVFDLFPHERIVGTGEQHRIHMVGLQLFCIFMDGGFQFRAAESFSFDQRYEFGTALAEYLDPGAQFLDFPFVGSGRNGEVRGKETHPVVLRDQRHHAGTFGHPDHVEGITAPDRIRAQHRNGIAGHHQLFDVPLVEPGCHIGYKAGDFFPAAVAVGGTGCIADEDEVFVGHFGLEPFKDGQAAYAGIDDTNGLCCLHE